MKKVLLTCIVLTLFITMIGCTKTSIESPALGTKVVDVEEESNELEIASYLIEVMPYMNSLATEVTTLRVQMDELADDSTLFLDDNYYIKAKGITRNIKAYAEDIKAVECNDTEWSEYKKMLDTSMDYYIEACRWYTESFQYAREGNWSKFESRINFFTEAMTDANEIHNELGNMLDE